MARDLRGICHCRRLDLTWGKHMESREDCLGEASECDRLRPTALMACTRNLPLETNHDTTI